MLGLPNIIIGIRIDAELEVSSFVQPPVRDGGGKHPLAFFVEHRHVARFHTVARRLRVHIMMEQIIRGGFVMA